MVLLIIDGKSTGYHTEKKKRKMLTPYKTINSRWSTDPRKKCAIIHLSEYNTGEHLHYLGIEKDFLNVTKKALINHNRNTVNLDYLKTINFWSWYIKSEKAS